MVKMNGRVVFSAPFPGVEFSDIKYISNEPKAKDVSVNSNEKDGITLNIIIEDATSLEDAFDVSQKVSTYVANILCVHLASSVGSFRLKEHALVKIEPESEPVHELGNTLGLFCKVDIVKSLNDSQVKEIETLLSQNNHAGYENYELFRSALSLTDPLSKFMALYNIVLALSGDTQEAVDTFILAVQPDIATNPPFHTRRSGIDETVYTRLRNEIGHKREGTTLEKTRNEMDANLSGLIKVTLAIIKR